MAALFFSASPTLKPKTTNTLSDLQRPRLSTVTLPSTPTSNINHNNKGRWRTISSHATPTSPSKSPKRPKPNPPVFSDGKNPEDGPPLCPGCGVFMQNRDPNLPGYYIKKRDPKEEPLPFEKDDEIEDGLLSKFDLDDDILMGLEIDDSEEEEEEEEEEVGEEEKDIDWDSNWAFEGIDFDNGADEMDEKELDGFGPAGVGYGNTTEETLKILKKEKISKSEKKKKLREARRMAMDDGGVVVCARCHSLRHYGQVKNRVAENLIPDFDFDRLVVDSLMKPASTAPVVVMVVDCVDFDGSFPKRAAKSLFKVLEGEKGGRLPKLVLVATKVDLLPSQISPTRLDRWVRNRAKAWGAPKLSGVYLVSSHKDLGVRNLLSFIKELSGPRSNVWVIGAQNAGKSTLINSFAKKEGVKISRLTEAAVPGTTLGIIRIGNLLPNKAKMYDTPGLLHPYLMSMRLNREEQKMVEIRKELQPRTYRVKAGHTVHVGGLARLDVTRSSVETIYVTVWVSQSISLHLGKTENAEEISNNHIGVRLQPPVEQDRVSQIGQWTQREMKVSGVSWDVNSSDITIAGLGWFSLGLKGEAKITLWTYDGVEVTQREPLVIDRAPFLERPGFLLPKAISDAVANRTKHASETKRMKTQKVDFLLEVGS